MKTLITAVFTISLLTIGVGAAAAQSGYDLFQQALVKERADGNLAEAIQLYRRIVRDFAADRALAARALVQMGRSYERLGDPEAHDAYERVVRDYADQAEQVAEAQARLAALLQVRQGPLVRRVWEGPELFESVNALSPDGRHMTYVDWDTGNLAIIDLTTGDKRPLTNKSSWAESSASALYSTVSPGGHRVAYSWSDAEAPAELRSIGLDGARPRILYRNEELTNINPVQWFDGEEHILAVLSRKDRTRQIAVISVADASVRVLKTLDWRSPMEINISPDGRYVVYDFPQGDGSPNRDVFLLSTDGSREVRVAQHPANDYLLGWIPGSEQILIASDRGGSLSAWSMSVVDGEPQGFPELIKPNIGPAFSLGFSESGAFHYVLQTAMLDVYTATLDSVTGQVETPPVRVTRRFIGRNSGPDWSPNGKYLAFRRASFPSTDARPSIVIRASGAADEREVPTALFGMHVRGPRWSPDGRSLLVIGADERNRWGVYEIDALTGGVHSIALNEPRRFAGVLSIGGEFPTTLRPLAQLREARRLKVFLATGRQSRNYPEHEVCRHLRLMPAAGISLNLRLYPCGDDVTTDMLADMDRWIMEQVASGQPVACDQPSYPSRGK